MNRRITLLTIMAAVIFAFCLPGLASAQVYNPWGRASQRDDRDYRRDRNNNYDSRSLRDAARRLKDGTRRLENDANRNLDRNRVDGSNREDRINGDLQDFRRAAERFNSSVGNGRDLSRSESDAQQVLSAAARIATDLSRFQLDSRTFSDWSALQNDLHYVADTFGLRYNSDEDRGNRNDRWRRRY